MYNWIIFGMLVAFLYIVNYVIKKRIRPRNKLNVIYDNKIDKLKKIRVKTLEEQMKFLTLQDRRKKLYGDPWKKFFYIIILMVIFLLLNGNLDNYLSILFTVIYSFTAPIPYILIIEKDKDRMYNYWSMFVLFFFFHSYLTIQKIDILILFGVKMRILYMLPGFFIINWIIKLVQEKIFKSANKKRN